MQFLKVRSSTSFHNAMCVCSCRKIDYYMIRFFYTTHIPNSWKLVINHSGYKKVLVIPHIAR